MTAMASVIRATFLDVQAALKARQRLLDEGIADSDMAMAVGSPSLAQETAREGRVMWRIVLIIVGASVIWGKLSSTLLWTMCTEVPRAALPGSISRRWIG